MIIRKASLSDQNQTSSRKINNFEIKSRQYGVQAQKKYEPVGSYFLLIYFFGQIHNIK